MKGSLLPDLGPMHQALTGLWRVWREYERRIEALERRVAELERRLAAPPVERT